MNNTQDEYDRLLYDLEHDNPFDTSPKSPTSGMEDPMVTSHDGMDMTDTSSTMTMTMPQKLFWMVTFLFAVTALFLGGIALEWLLEGSRWNTFTPTFNTGAIGTATVNEWLYRRDGKTLHLSVELVQSGGTAGTATDNYYITLPEGLTARTNSSADFKVVGSGLIWNQTQQFAVTVRVDTKTPTRMYLQLFDYENNNWPIWGPRSTSDFTLDKNLDLSFFASIPIV